MFLNASYSGASAVVFAATDLKSAPNATLPITSSVSFSISSWQSNSAPSRDRNRSTIS